MSVTFTNTNPANNPFGVIFPSVIMFHPKMTPGRLAVLLSYVALRQLTTLSTLASGDKPKGERSVDKMELLNTLNKEDSKSVRDLGWVEVESEDNKVSIKVRLDRIVEEADKFLGLPEGYDKADEDSI